MIRDTTGGPKHTDRSATDRRRHRKKVDEAIREKAADIIAEESIIGRDKDRIIKVPIRGIKEYRFVYGDNQSQAGAGEGGTESGQVIGKAPKDGEGAGRAGDQPGVDYYETDVTLEELIDIMFADLELPDMERKILRQVMAERTSKRKGYRRVGVRVHLDRRKTAKARVRRKVASGLGATPTIIDEATHQALPDEERVRYFVDHEEGVIRLRFPFRREDMTYKNHVDEPHEESNAVVICVMDTSGSMDSKKKYLARAFFFLLHAFITTKYENVDLVFIAHHTQAREVTQEEFFHKGESGGTIISSAYNEAIRIIKDRYHPSLWNGYFFHCSDGDNFDSDNRNALTALAELCELCTRVGYGEIKPMGSHYYESSMLDLYREIEANNFQTILIERKEDVYPGFRTFMTPDPEKRPHDYKKAA